MSNHRLLAAGLACLFALTSCTQGPPTENITIVTHIDFSAEPYQGTFELTDGPDFLGCERGTFVDTPAGDSVLKELTCEAGERSGTITLEFTPQDIPGDQSGQNGPWSVKDGSDDFSGLSGDGDFWVIYTDGGESGVETFIGEVQYVP